MKSTNAELQAKLQAATKENASMRMALEESQNTCRKQASKLDSFRYVVSENDRLRKQVASLEQCRPVLLAMQGLQPSVSLALSKFQENNQNDNGCSTSQRI